ncbi:MAG: DUF4276 family protein [Muribaculaceae bacterium]|nr:DUF4276 family protein [Muribaculaceae bacterium]
MSKRLYIVVEGQTEEEFVKDLMAPYFQDRGIYVYPMIIHTSKGHKGGFVNYSHLKNDINKLLKSQGEDIVVTTFVDFFRCPELPEAEKWEKIPNHNYQVVEMEKAISRDIDDRRFFPYIQLHEFEAVLFSSNNGFQKYFDEEYALLLQGIVDSYDNPEDINSSPEGAPSKRLIKIIPEYDKVMYGNIIALEIGITTILEKCPRFRDWVNTLLEICK